MVRESNARLDGRFRFQNKQISDIDWTHTHRQVKDRRDEQEAHLPAR